MTASAPNKLHRRLFLDDIATARPSCTEPGTLSLGEQQASWAVAGSSLYELRSQLEPHVAADLPDPLLVYLPDRQESEGRAVQLELLRAGSTFEIKLVRRARGYLREARKDDVPAADQEATTDLAGLMPISGGGGLIQTTSG